MYLRSTRRRGEHNLDIGGMRLLEVAAVAEKPSRARRSLAVDRHVTVESSWEVRHDMKREEGQSQSEKRLGLAAAILWISFFGDK
jgi:hypothetical protein